MFVSRFVPIIFAAFAIAAAQTSDVQLVPGNPPLTRSMVDKRIAIWEWFLEAKLTPDQRARFQKAMVQAWPTNKNGVVQHTLTDVGLYGQEAELKPARAKLQAQYVESLRKDPDEESRILLEVYEAAHPARRDLMTPRGLGNLVGQWRRQDALAPSRNPVTNRPDGVAFTDSLILDIYSDVRFHHLWAHSHCSNGVMCCKEYGTEVNGTLSVDTSTLALSAESGDLLYQDPCTPAMNKSEKLPPERQSFRWSLQKDPESKQPALCLSGRPFQFDRKELEKAVCYTKEK